MIQNVVKNRAALMLAATVAAATLTACGTTPPNQDLVAAHQVYQAAANDPAVVQEAPLALKQAQADLSRADALAQKGEDMAAVDHFAYLATRHTQIAQQTARLAEARKVVSNAGTARTQALLSARTQEATQARQNTAEARQEAQRAQQRAQQLQQQLAKLEANQAEGGMVLTLGNILFNVNGSQLKPGAYDDIQKIADFLKQHPERTVTIEGFTDSTGSAAYNLNLSRLRADAVRSALIQDGVPADRIVARGYGETAPVASNDTVAGRQLNRRVEVAISDQNGRNPGTPVESTGSSSRPASAGH